MSNQEETRLWIQSPTAIKRFNNKSNYLFIDESGDYSNESIKYIKKYISGEEQKLEKHYHVFSMVGVLIKGNELRERSTKLRILKRKYWNKLIDPDTNKEICLHGRELYAKRGVFNIFKDNPNLYREFTDDWDRFIIDTKFKMFATSINKYLSYMNGNIQPNIDNKIFEKVFVELLDSVNATSKSSNIVVIYESINEKKDTKLLNIFKGNIQNGRWNKFVGIYFMPKHMEIHNKHRSILGFELADALNYPVCEWTLCANYHKIRDKFYYYPYQENKTLKIIN